jgi:hypothetical protein
LNREDQEQLNSPKSAKLRKEGSAETDQKLSFFRYRRFGPGALLRIFLLALLSFFLYAFGYAIFALIPVILVALTVLTNSLVIFQPRKPDQRLIVGGKCHVVRNISRAQRGVVKVYKQDGNFDHELWSAESANGEIIEEGRDAKVVGIRGIILQVEPL